jgi:hypothetical protein
VLALNLLDRSWAALLHSSKWLLPKGHYGFLGRFMQTLPLHRVYHGRNAIYKDRNLASIIGGPFVELAYASPMGLHAIASPAAISTERAMQSGLRV